MIARFCGRCGKVVEGKCSTCKQTSRKTTKQKGYDSRWKSMSENIRRERPLCEDCLDRGVVRPSQECHHVVAINTDWHRRLDPNNVIALCKECHHRRHEE